MNWKTIVAVLFLPVAPAFVDSAFTTETLRGPLIETPRLSTEAEQTIEFTLGTGEISAVELERDSRFLDGLELEIGIPSEVRLYAESFGLYVLSSVSKADDRGYTRLTGEAVLFETLPKSRRVFVLIPLHPKHRMRASADSFLVRRRLELKDLPLALTVRPVMKGLPGTVQAARFPVKVRTVFREEGAARIMLTDSDGADVTYRYRGNLDDLTLQIGEYIVEDIAEEIVLPSGLHQARLRSERYIDQAVTFGVERGVVQTVQLTVEEEKSTIYVDAPIGAKMYLNGERVDRLDQEIEVLPGEHTVLFEFGEYTISRKITVEPKRDYKVSLSLDIIIVED